VKEEDKAKVEKKEQRKCPEEPPTGYIHVRARRGQATDSHSLAERVLYSLNNLKLSMVVGPTNVLAAWSFIFMSHSNVARKWISGEKREDK